MFNSSSWVAGQTAAIDDIAVAYMVFPIRTMVITNDAAYVAHFIEAGLIDEAAGRVWFDVRLAEYRLHAQMQPERPMKPSPVKRRKRKRLGRPPGGRRYVVKPAPGV